jgi:hypothetical protein
MKNLTALALVVGSVALSACTTVETRPEPRTTTTTTEESVVHHPAVGSTTVTTGTQVSPY